MTSTTTAMARIAMIVEKTASPSARNVTSDT